MKQWRAVALGVLLVVALAGGAAPMALAAPAAEKSWGAPDGGGVVIKANGAYTILCDDAADGSSFFSEGRVAGDSQTAEGGVTYRLKPTTPGQERWSLEIDAKADGTGDLYVAKAGARHLVAHLTK